MEGEESEGAEDLRGREEPCVRSEARNDEGVKDWKGAGAERDLRGAKVSDRQGGQGEDEPVD